MADKGEYNSIHDGPTIDAAVLRASEGGFIDASIQAKPNPNLLDNWYFGNPVNQRGQTSWSGLSDYGMTIDRWGYSKNTVATLTSNGVTLKADWQQHIENTRLLVGQQYTMSVLTSDGRLGKTTFTFVNGIDVNVAVGIGYLVIYNGSLDPRTMCRIYGDGNTYLAVKLELGTQQTLAHQDADGNWVLNEIPDYGEQLRRCQRYFVRIGVPAAQETAAIGFANCANTTLANTCINTPVTMRAIPTATIKNIVLRKGITDSNVTACNIFSITGNGIYMNFTSSGLTTGDTLLIRTVTGGYIDFTADL